MFGLSSIGGMIIGRHVNAATARGQRPHGSRVSPATGGKSTGHAQTAATLSGGPLARARPRARRVARVVVDKG